MVVMMARPEEARARSRRSRLRAVVESRPLQGVKGGEEGQGWGAGGQRAQHAQQAARRWWSPGRCVWQGAKKEV